MHAWPPTFLSFSFSTFYILFLVLYGELIPSSFEKISAPPPTPNGLEINRPVGGFGPPAPSHPYPMLCCGRLDTTEYPGFFLSQTDNQHGGYDERMPSVRKSSIFGEFLPVSTVRMTIFVKLIFYNFEEECLKLKLYCSYGRLERSVFRQLVVLNSLPRLVLASFVSSFVTS